MRSNRYAKGSLAASCWEIHFGHLEASTVLYKDLMVGENIGECYNVL